MSKLTISILAAALACGALAASPAAALESAECEVSVPAFGFCEADVTFSGEDGAVENQAGSHPAALTTTIAPFTEDAGPGIGKIPSGQPRDLRIELPTGFVGSPDATPRCDSAHFSTTVFYAGGAAALPDCPNGTSIGLVRARGALGNGPEAEVASPIYNLVPPPGVVARLGVTLNFVGSVVIDLTLSQTAPYQVIAHLPDITQTQRFYGAEAEIWSDPGASSHDNDRGVCGAVLEIAGIEGVTTDLGDFLGISCPASIPPRPLVTLPRTCEGPLRTLFEATSWTGESATAEAVTHGAFGEPLGLGGCERLGLAPAISAQPTNHSASSPSGLDFGLDIEDKGLTDVAGIAGSDIKRAVVTLPEGVTINPSQAEGLSVCSKEDFARERADSEFGAGCPGASKIGTVEAESPLLEGVVLRGSVFVATPRDNLAGDSLIAIYFTLKEPERGLNIGLVGKVTPDPATGQIVTTLEDLPQLPASHFRFHFREGSRSPLITPLHCGAYRTEAVFTPWADPGRPVTTTASFQIEHGVGGAACPPAGTPPFEPGFEAGSLNSQAGAYSPFQMRLTRRDGDQDLTRFSSTLPLGLVAKLAGVDRCPDSQIALAKAKTGKAELASPSCPANSRIGSVTGGAGAGDQLTYVPGSLYLAGPYNGAPLSVVSVVPAVAGPFDVGTIVTRFALEIDPRTARVTVDGSRSDPIPHILEGIPLAVRDVRAVVDRPSFALNPTSCDPTDVGAEIWGSGENAFSSLDDSPMDREARFQTAGCRGLGFRPRLALRLIGGTGRGAHPRLRGSFRPRPGDANLQRLVLRLPHSAFLDQAHIRTICTRVQFAAHSCPKGAIYGHVRAFTPLLDEPLEGPAYLRSSSHNLPDLVFALHGLVDFEAVARIDSKHGGIRATFTQVPDAPISRVQVDMQGSRKGLIVNSTDLCARPHRANAAMRAHNGARRTIHPLLRPRCAKRRAHRRHRRAR